MGSFTHAYLTLQLTTGVSNLPPFFYINSYDRQVRVIPMLNKWFLSLTFIEQATHPGFARVQYRF
jgi:hypothetical protein